MQNNKRIVLAYSGGLDTSIILKWLQENYNAEIIAYTADIGQKINKKIIIKNAKSLGVKKVIIENLKDVFVEKYVYPMIRGHAVYITPLAKARCLQPLCLLPQKTLALIMDSILAILLTLILLLKPIIHVLTIQKSP